MSPLLPASQPPLRCRCCARGEGCTHPCRAPQARVVGALQPSLEAEQARTASPFKPYRPTTPQPWSGSETRVGERGASADAEPASPFSDWEVEGDALGVCRTDDGQPVILGQGSFGTVSCYVPIRPTRGSGCMT